MVYFDENKGFWNQEARRRKLLISGIRFVEKEMMIDIEK